MNFKNFIVFSFLLLLGFATNAQDSKYPKLDVSSMDAASYPRTAAFNNYMPDDQKEDLKVKVLYSRPKKKDRVIFGELVPYGKEWRLGANEATEVTFFQHAEIGGQFIGRGSYTLFADVYPNQWIIKVSSERFIAGNNNRDASKDLVAVAVPVNILPDSRESFTIGFQEVDEDHCNMIFEWDQVQVALPISFNPAFLSGDDASPMDLVQYPANSRIRNFVKEEEFEASAPKVRVVYSRPQKKGRTIFGDLVKYGENWRIGANETTEITFFDGVKIGGKEIRSGRYGMFAKVNEDNWEVVIHSNIPSWGVANHDDEKNVASVTVPVQKTGETVEALSMLFEKKTDKEIHLIIAWDNTKVAVPIFLD